MNDTMLVLAAVAVAIAVGLALYRQVFRWKKRTEAWQAIAPELGLAATPGNVGLAQRFPSLAFFNHGRRRLTRAVLEGGAGGGRVVVGDYQYTTGAGRNQRVHAQTVCVFEVDGLALPAFALRPEHGVVDRIGQALGMQDIDFEEDPEFSRAFVLTGEDETQLRAWFHLERRQRLVQLATARFHVEGRGDLLLVHPGRLLAPADGREFLQRATDVLDALRR